MSFRTIPYPRLIAIGFALIILIGAGLLCLPIATNSGEATPFFSSLFTATSATCVTGLVVVDTAAHWSLFGQTVILILIQIGGIGFITLMTAVSILIHRNISLKERTLLKESYNTPDLHGLARLTKRIVWGTLLFEGIGAVLLCFRTVPLFGWGSGIYKAVFLSVSAFCNAGFDPFGTYGGQFCSLVPFNNDPLVLFTVSALIIIGGLGFIVWDDLAKNTYHVRRYRLHTKLVLSVSAAALLVGTVLFFVLERNATGADMPIGQQWLNAWFDSVTPRTAGFNAVDTASLTPASQFLTCILMFIGGSPGSTAGGIKTVTFAVLVICLFSHLRRRSGFNTFKRRLPKEVLINALCVVGIHLSGVVVATFVIAACHPELSFLDILFECFSGMGTVGMTTGITRQLSTVPQLVLILLMYSGRLGSLSFAMIFTQTKKQEIARFPEETVGIG